MTLWNTRSAKRMRQTLAKEGDRMGASLSASGIADDKGGFKLAAGRAYTSTADSLCLCTG